MRFPGIMTMGAARVNGYWVPRWTESSLERRRLAAVCRTFASAAGRRNDRLIVITTFYMHLVRCSAPERVSIWLSSNLVTIEMMCGCSAAADSP